MAVLRLSGGLLLLLLGWSGGYSGNRRSQLSASEIRPRRLADKKDEPGSIGKKDLFYI
jgi:hypothetical protein